MDEPTRRQVKVEASAVAKTIASGSKSSRTGLAVKFEDGTVLSGGIAADTFAKAIKKLGFQRVIDLGGGSPLFSIGIETARRKKYNQTEIDGYLVMTHSSTEDKRDQLVKIATALKEPLTIVVVPCKK